MDFIELMQSDPYKYCLVMTDAFSKWVEITPSKYPDLWQKLSVKLLSLIMGFHKLSSVIMDLTPTSEGLTSFEIIHGEHIDFLYLILIYKKQKNRY